MRIAALAANEKKGEEIVALHVHDLTSLADYFLVITARSATQARAIYESIDQAMTAAGREPLHVEGNTAFRWVLMDYADVVIHILLPEERDFYSIEKLWVDAPTLDWSATDTPANQ